MMLIALKGENAIKKMRDNIENILCEKVEKQNSHLQLDDNLTKSNTTGKQYSWILEERNYHHVFHTAYIIHSVRPNFSLDSVKTIFQKLFRSLKTMK